MKIRKDWLQSQSLSPISKNKYQEIFYFKVIDMNLMESFISMKP